VTPAQLCVDCVSFAPLVSGHSGSLPSFLAAPLVVEGFTIARNTAIADRRQYAPFRSRAPPR